MRQDPGGAVGEGRQADRLERLLDALGDLATREQQAERLSVQPRRDVVGQVRATHRQHAGVHDRALREQRHVGGAAADVDQRDAELLLVLVQHRQRGRQRQ